MTDVSQQNITIWRGTTRAVVWVPLTNPDGTQFEIPDGAVFYLRIVDREGAELIAKNTDDDSAVLVANQGAEETSLTFTPTAEESRSVPEGRLGRYEIEMWVDGDEIPIGYGFVTGRGGVNTDA